MEDQKSRHRRLPFAYSLESERVNDEIHSRLERRAIAMREGFMSPSNVYRMKHGRRWQTMHSSNPEEATEVRLHSAETSISRTAIIDHDVGQLAKFLSDAAKKMHELFMTNMFDTLDDATRRSGNVVSGKGLKQSLEEMLNKVSFGVDRFGKPSAPQAFAPPGVMRQIEQLARNPDPEQEVRIAAIIQRKEAEAISDEARRISRYVIRK